VNHLLLCESPVFCRNDNYQYVNELLRDQLDKATAANVKLITELNSLKHQHELKETEWTKEQQV